MERARSSSLSLFFIVLRFGSKIDGPSGARRRRPSEPSRPLLARRTCSIGCPTWPERRASSKEASTNSGRPSSIKPQPWSITSDPWLILFSLTIRFRQPPAQLLFWPVIRPPGSNWTNRPLSISPAIGRSLGPPRLRSISRSPWLLNSRLTSIRRPERPARTLRHPHHPPYRPAAAKFSTWESSIPHRPSTNRPILLSKN